MKLTDDEVRDMIRRAIDHAPLVLPTQVAYLVAEKLRYELPFTWTHAHQERTQGGSQVVSMAREVLAGRWVTAPALHDAATDRIARAAYSAWNAEGDPGDFDRMPDVGQDRWRVVALAALETDRAERERDQS